MRSPKNTTEKKMTDALVAALYLSGPGLVAIGALAKNVPVVLAGLWICFGIVCLTVILRYLAPGLLVQIQETRDNLVLIREERKRRD